MIEGEEFWLIEGEEEVWVIEFWLIEGADHAVASGIPYLEIHYFHSSIKIH